MDKTNPQEAMLGWFSRGYLPHFDNHSSFQSITFRLADAIPQKKIDRIKKIILHFPEDEQKTKMYRLLEDWQDTGKGCCALRDPRLAAVVQKALQHFHGERYELIAWCIMPNHVHVLIKQYVALGKIVGSWKSYTGRIALAHNEAWGLNIPGKQFWMREYWDRYIRSERHFNYVIAYIHQNPIKAGLCKHPYQWPWSSAYYPTQDAP